MIRRDGSGHKADDRAVSELERLGLARPDGNDIVFTESGLAMLADAVKGLRSASA
ncbi:hypothetical protein [Enterovirga aerilata]|uniref:hypothetical protein n=1 Tax=Enterovirga aerilata TaxID=2730920 RepID=UPI001FEED3BD|nr:hypothetical protein [Enterovirga sp. DB1703]